MRPHRVRPYQTVNLLPRFPAPKFSEGCDGWRVRDSLSRSDEGLQASGRLQAGVPVSDVMDPPKISLSEGACGRNASYHRLMDKRPDILIAAHGSGGDSDPNEHPAYRHASLLRGNPRVGRVEVAFYKHPPFLRDAATDGVTVAPLLMSDGYFAGTVFPRELAAAAGDDGQEPFKVAGPVGLHPGIVDIIEIMVAEAADELGVSADSCDVLLVGHGSHRDAESTHSTLRAAETLRCRSTAPAVHTAFLDAVPLLESLRTHCTRSYVVVVPFLVADGDHSLNDIPQRIGLGDPVAAAQLSAHFEAVAITPAVGEHPAIADLLVDCVLTVASSG